MRGCGAWAVWRAVWLCPSWMLEHVCIAHGSWYCARLEAAMLMREAAALGLLGCVRVYALVRDVRVLGC
eukprot:5228187-Prymnesium_polylepis.1